MDVNAQIHLSHAEIHKKMHNMQKRTIAEVLSNLMDRAGIGPTELHRKTGVDQTTISRIRMGKIKSPRDTHVSAIADFFGVSTEQLRGRAPLDALAQKDKLSFTNGNEQLQKGTVVPLKNGSNVTEGPAIAGLIPLISWIQAGNFCEAIDMFQPGDAEDWVPSPGPCSKHSYSLRVRGRSMEPEFWEGEIVIVDPEIAADSGKFVIAKRTSQNDCTLKRLIQEGGEYYLEAVNKDWPEQIIKINEDWHICGVVLYKVKSYK